jgi:predicted NAD/FAD-binding protein
MPFDAQSRPVRVPHDGRKRRIAVIGSGISGLSAAWLLSGRHDVVVYERDRRLGGHANTADVPVRDRSVPVDAGFIVFNKPNYPNLTALFDRLGVEVSSTDMSFGISMDDGRVEFSSRGANGIFSKRSSLVSASHWSMLGDIVRFNRDARSALSRGIDDNMTVGAFVGQRSYSQAFVRRFLAPMAAAIWSTPSFRVLDHPAASLFRFYANHGLLQISNMPRWCTVKGGSRVYVERISESFRGTARVGIGAAEIERTPAGVIVVDEMGAKDLFDDVVIATHADRALKLLKDPTAREREILGAFKYQSNRAYLHFDRDEMPRRRSAWASWNYRGGENAASVTYWMNRLQSLPCEEDLFVTLNPTRPIPGDRIVAQFDYDHPVFDLEVGKAQKELWSLQGLGGVWFCGAHFGAGFHEDGVQSGLAVAEDIGGVKRPWSVENESGRIWRRPVSMPSAAA